MNVFICPDSFKGSCDAERVAAALARGWSRARPDDTLVELPLADGGEGTGALMARLLDGERRELLVAGPLPRQQVQGHYVWFDASKTALIELAVASGIELVGEENRDPLRATTYGTGQLIRAAIDAGAKRLILTLGGSATTDGGTGMASALGMRFLDDAGHELAMGGGALARLKEIDDTQRRTIPSLDVWCDVTNPLVGPRGAAAVYGPQKGATPEQVEELDAALLHLATVVDGVPDGILATLPGGGAAGGAAAGAVAFLGGRLCSGTEEVFAWCRIDEAIAGADLILTGEGCFDTQSVQGKLVGSILIKAGEAGVPVHVFCGATDPAVESDAAGVYPISEGVSRDEAFSRTAELLEEHAFRCAEALG